MSTSVGYNTGLALDSSGNLYIANGSSSIVLKVSPAGIATVFAGTGRYGYSGDGGPASSAELGSPSALVFDLTGNLFIADSEYSVIRKVSTSGTISTFAGTGNYGYSGDGGPAIAAELSYPDGIAIDTSGNVYLADSDNQVIRKISAGGTISTFAGTGSASYTGDGGQATLATFHYPNGVALDAAGNVYVADSRNEVIRKISTVGIITTVAGNHTYGYSGDGGPATSAQLNYPYAVVLDAGGNLYIDDSNNSVIRKVTPGGTITTIAGNGTNGYSGDGGPAISATLNYPSIAILGPGGILFIADSENYAVREVSGSGTITTFAGNGDENYGGDTGPAINALFAAPEGLALGSDGSLYIADYGNNRIRKLSSDGVVTTIAGTGVYGYSGDGGLATAAELGDPGGIAIDVSGDIFVADSGNSVVRMISPAGIISTIAGTGSGGYSGDGGLATAATLGYPLGLALDSAGNLYVADPEDSVIRKIATDGIITTVAGNGAYAYSGDGGPATSAVLNYPDGVAIDASGNLFIADTNNSVIRVVNTAGIITTISSTSGLLDFPDAVAVDASGNLYIADTDDLAVQEVLANGTLVTIAGENSYGYSGDGGPAIAADLGYVEGIAVAPNGTVYVADSGNNAIRSLTSCITALALLTNADSTAQIISLPLTAPLSCTWAPTNLPSWITSSSSGSGSGTLALTLSANTSGADRTAVITVSGRLLIVEQAFTVKFFTDVAPVQYYFDAVNLLETQGITSGCAVNDYCPTEQVTRAEMAIFLVRAIVGTGIFAYSPTPHFNDVQISDYGFAYIQKFYELGITLGCAPSLFCPTDSVTRAQMAVFIIRARYGSGTIVDYPPTAYFTDVPISAFAFNYIQRLKQDNITSGCSLTTYCPDDLVTRGDMALFVMRGAFNQLLPSTEPVISSISPATIANATTGTFTVTGLNTNFTAGTTTVNAVAGLTVNSVTFVNPTTLTVSLTVNVSGPQQPISIWITDPTEQAVLPNGLLPF